MAIHPIIENLPVPEAVLVGPLPAEIQNYTVYAGAVSAQSANAAAAKQLFDALRSPATAAILQSKGMQAP